VNDQQSSACYVCGNRHANRLHYPREMMFGLGEVFEYLECGYCACLQIADIPADLGRYYSGGYYSYKAPKEKRHPPWVRNLRKRRTRALLGESDVIGSLLAGLSKHRAEHFDWLGRAGVRLDSAILDVGCGSGSLLRQMQRDGFSDLLGIDPFLERDIDYGNGLQVLKRSIGELDRRFDFIMLNHSFEHMPDPRHVLQQLRNALKDHGTLLLRVPVADSYARRKYGVHWVAWDAPRHLFLHTVRSMHLLAQQAAFDVLDVTYDSSRLQFYGSELYLRGVAFKDQKSYTPGNGPKAFTQGEWDRFALLAAELNTYRDGDTACFFLRPA
jgi:SAM-dependent methyltransferase